MSEKIDGFSMDLENANMEKLKTVFPECFSEGRLDIDKLLSLCGEYIDNDFEKYKFEWKGKMESLKLAQKRSTGTLRPCREESVNFDDTQNIYIEGDNLEVLKLLQTAYYNKIKMIYIDKTISRLIRRKLQSSLFSRLFQTTDPQGLIFLVIRNARHFGYGAKMNELYIIERT